MSAIVRSVAKTFHGVHTGTLLPKQVRWAARP